MNKFMICTVAMTKEDKLFTKWDMVACDLEQLAKEMVLMDRCHELQNCAAAAQQAISIDTSKDLDAFPGLAQEYSASPYGIKCKLVYHWLVGCMNNPRCLTECRHGEKYRILMQKAQMYFGVSELEIDTMMSDYLSLIQSLCELEIRCYKVGLPVDVDISFKTSIARGPFEQEQYQALLRSNICSMHQLYMLREPEELYRWMQKERPEIVEQTWRTLKYCVLTNEMRSIIDGL